MAHYKYVALSKNGVRVSGVMEAFNEMDAANRIRERCDIIEKIIPVKEGKPGILNQELGGNHLDSKAFTVMCSQFAIILDAGIPVARAVQLVADKTTNKTLKRLLEKVAKDVDAGRAVSAAFADHGEKLLPVTFIETLRAGEATGNLASSFRTMHTHFDKTTKMRAKVRGAMAYPLFVLLIAVAVVIVLMVKVVPAFTETFESMGAELPAPTRLLIAISHFFQNYYFVILAAIVLIWGILQIVQRSEKGKIALAKIRLKLPVLGEIEELNAASQFANTMSSMLGAGIPMNRAVSITSKIITNYHLQVQTEKLSGQLEAGRMLGASMKDETDYPDILIDMTSIGESSGEPERTLGTIANYYDSELEEAIKAALAKLEPALLVCLAVIAGFIVIAIYMAMFGMYDIMGNA